MAPPRLRPALVTGALFAVAPIVAVLSIDGEPFDLVWPLCALLGVEAVWAAWTWRRRSGSLFDPYLLFFASTLVFNGGQALLEIFGLNEGGLLGGEYSPSELVRTLAFVISALGALHVGALLAVRRRAPGCRPVDAEERRPLYLAGLLLGAVAVVPVWLRLNAATRVVLSGGYMALYQSAAPAGLDSAVVILDAFILPAAFLLIAARPGRFAGGWLPWTALVAYGGSLLFLGYRANSIFPLIAALWLRGRLVRPVRALPVAAAAAFLMVIVFPLVRQTRGVAGSDRASISFLKDAMGEVERPLVAALSEMGGSMLTISETMRLVPSSHAWELGEGYAYAALTVVPSLLWPRHPSIARGTPATWLIEQVDPVQAALGGSLGFSVIAETYLNFGWAGTLLMALLGFAVARCWVWAEERGGAALVLLASVLPSLLFFARSDASTLVRPILWYAIGPFLIVRLIARYSRKSAPRAIPA